MLDEILDANERYAADLHAAELEAPPARQLAVVTCMDARVEPSALLGLDLGDAHVIRNAGGRVTSDTIRSLAVSSHLLGTTHVLVIHHTRCGMQGATDQEIRARLPDAVAADAEGIDFLPFDDLEDSVRDDVRTIVGHPVLAHLEVSGFVYDVVTGRLREVGSRPDPERLRG